jgi:hypothetical protein
MKKHIFISHATPEDNDFSIWLASRLEMFGYKVWIDKEGLLGGERIWATIQKAIDMSYKILFVYSKHIITKDGILKSGIESEIEYGKSIAIQENISDYIIPLHIDIAPYNLAIGFPNINQIPFSENWAEGLKLLVRKLEKDNIPKTFDVLKSTLAEWYENEYISNCSIILKKELFYTSWWTVNNMPQRFYMYQFHNREQAKAIRDLNNGIPIALMSNVLSAFDEDLLFTVERENETFDIQPENKYSFSLTDIFNSFESEKFPQFRDVENHFKNLLRCVISNLFRKSGLWKTEMSNKRIAYFLPKYYDKILPVRFKYPYSAFDQKEKRKSILGTYKEIGFWHYAISVQPLLFPFLGFSLKSHLIFSTDGKAVITDDKKSHSYRREKGKRFFNEAWKDMQLAYIQRLKDNEGKIEIKVSLNNEYFEMKEWPEMFWSEVGYLDPKSNMDLDKIDSYSEESLIEGNDD